MAALWTFRKDDRGILVAQSLGLPHPEMKKARPEGLAFPFLVK